MEDIEVTDARVTYTTKELLRRIDERFERLETMVTNVPSRTEFQHLDSRVAVIEDEQIAVRAVAVALKEDKSSRFNHTDKWVLGVFAAITLLLNIMALGPDVLHFP